MFLSSGIETFDLKRLQQFEEFSKDPERLKDKFKIEFQTVYHYNLQRNRLIDVKSGSTITIDPTKPTVFYQLISP